MEKKPTALKSKRRSALPESNEPETSGIKYDLIVFSHLRWDFVYQRPQHIISRLSKDLKVLFVEEPVPFHKDEEGTFEKQVIGINLHVFKPKAKDIPGIIEILKNFLDDRHIEIGWFYSAAFSEVLSEFRFKRVVYDCMDELSLFRGANPELVRQEKFLLSEADIVFTGGKSLYEAKSKKHPNVYCFPSSVERQHFSKAQQRINIPSEMKDIKNPVVGYFGVIDERIDLQLLQKVALLRPTISFVMIGPLAKISDEDLPQEKNIHYLGMKSYKDLPNYLAAFDIAMMPFALNDSTRFISPTKTLEYMAAGKPIISTPIKDVERDYSHCISIVSTAEEFSLAVDQMLEFDKDEIQKDFEKILNKTSWDNTANSMKNLIQIEIKA